MKLLSFYRKVNMMFAHFFKFSKENVAKYTESFKHDLQLKFNGQHVDLQNFQGKKKKKDKK